MNPNSLVKYLVVGFKGEGETTTMKKKVEIAELW